MALIPCTSVVYIVIGYMVATFLCNFLRVPSNERNAVTCTVMFGNTGALAIALMTSLARTGSPHRFETYISIGVSYIALVSGSLISLKCYLIFAMISLL